MQNHKLAEDTIRSVLGNPDVSSVILVPVSRSGSPSVSLMVSDNPEPVSQISPAQLVAGAKALAEVQGEYAQAVAEMAELLARELKALRDLTSGSQKG